MYAPVCSYRTLRILLAISAYEGLELRQFDIRTAFLNGNLDEEVCMKPPVGAEGVGCLRGRVLRLRRALYGLQQAPRAWHKRLTAELKAKGFVKSNADPSHALWILYGSRGVVALFYVDDGMVDAKTTEEAEALVQMLATLFDIRALGEPMDFLGVRIHWVRSAGTISIDQEDKARALAVELKFCWRANSGQCL
jgi:hypothetical protein